MIITFILPYAGLAGGTRVVSVYAQKLQERGHDVTVLSLPPRAPGVRNTARNLIKRRKVVAPWRPAHGPSHMDGRDVDWRILPHDGPVTDEDVPDGDIVVATWWETAEWVSKLDHSKGRKVYFCQHYECHPYLPVERVVETYRLPMRQICVSQWVAEQIRNIAPDAKQSIVPNSVDTDFFAPDPRKLSRPFVAGFMYRAGWKGADIAIDALTLAKQRHPQMRAVAFSANSPNPSTPVPDWVEFLTQPSQVEIRDIYRSCRCWLFASRSEGFGLPILEAMACGTPVIGTPAGAAPELLGDGVGVLVPHEDPDAMSSEIIRFANMPDDAWRKYSICARERAASYTWDDATASFESVLEEPDSVSKRRDTLHIHR